MAATETKTANSHAVEYAQSKTSNIITNEALSKTYGSFLEYIPCHFHISGQCKFPEIIIPNIDTKNAIQYPLSPSIISKIRAICKPSPVGIDTKTVHDERIRISKELDTSQFSIIDTSFDLSSRNNQCLERIRKSLLPHIEYIKCEPYKLLLYERNSFFKPHVDTAISMNHFGSLIISLPCYTTYNGGDFVLSFNGKQIEWKPKYIDSDDSLCEYMAFYCDVQHEIKPIIDGIRVVMTLNLMIPDDIKDIDFEKAMIDQKKHSTKNDYDYVSDQFYIEPIENIHLNPFYSPFIDHLFEMIANSKYCKQFPMAIIWIIIDFHGDHIIIEEIQNLLNDSEFHKHDIQKTDYSDKQNEYKNGVCLIFSHRYCGEFVNPLTLKGADMYLYRIFKQYFGIYLTPITIKSFIGTWTDEWFDEWGEWEDFEDDWEGKIIAEWEENDERTVWNITLGKEWFWRYPAKLKQEKINEFHSSLLLLYNNKNTTLSNAMYVNGGDEYYGNMGTYDIENKYHCFGLVLTRYDNDAQHSEQMKININ